MQIYTIEITGYKLYLTQGGSFAIRISEKFSKTNEKCRSVRCSYPKQYSEDILKTVWLSEI